MADATSLRASLAQSNAAKKFLSPEAAQASLDAEIATYLDEIDAARRFEQMLDELVAGHPEPRRLEIQRLQFLGSGRGSSPAGGVNVVWDIGGPILTCTFLRNPFNRTVMVTVRRPAIGEEAEGAAD